MAAEILSGWFCENWAYVLGCLFSFVATLAVVLYRVRVHGQVLFGNKGELNFVTHDEMKELKTECKSKTCPVHEGAMDLIAGVKTNQINNMERLRKMEHVADKADDQREKMLDALRDIKITLATLTANYVNMAQTVSDLKEDR